MNFFEITRALIFFMAVMLSLYGYGTLVTRNLFNQWKFLPGINALLGLLIFIAFSGYVELFHQGSRPLFYGITVIGAALAIRHIFTNKNDGQSDQLLIYRVIQLNSKKVLALLLAITFVFAYCVNMLFHDFNRGDDYSSYLIFPMRILAEGFSGGDPFNLRGIEHGLGGGDSINALVLSVNNASNLYLAESGIGFLLLSLLCIDQLRLSNRGFWICYLAFICASVTAILAQYTNVTPILSGCALGYGMLMIGQRFPSQFSPKFAVLIGGLCGALIILKGNLLAPALMFVGVIFLARLIATRKAMVFWELALTATSIALIMLPWMLASKSNHGTLFYPLLGKGFTYSGGFAFVPFKLFWGAVQEFIPLYSLTFASWLVFWTRSKDASQIRYLSILCLAVIPCTLILALTPAGMYRYCYVILATPCLYLITANLSISHYGVSKNFLGFSVPTTRYLIYFIIFVCSILMIHQTKRVGRHLFHDALYARYIALDQRSDLTDIDMASSALELNAKRYLSVQNSIPANKVVFAQVEAPFLLDFSRNKIWVADYPGSAGPRPFPYSSSIEDLANYFRDHQICYIMHSYRAWISRRESAHYNNVDLNPSYEWNKVMARQELLINNQMISLSDTYRVIYDDGRDRVVDLCQTPSAPSINLPR